MICSMTLMRRACSAVAFGAALAGCGGGGGVSAAAPTSVPTSQATATAKPTPMPTPAPATMIFAASRNNNPGRVLGFSLSTSGNVAPTINLGGALTGLQVPNMIAADASGKIYEADDSGTSIAIFAAGATGNVAPSATISGGNTGLSQISGLALDGAGNVYVADYATNSIYEFAAGQTGNAAPIRTIAGSSTQINQPRSVFVEPNGNIWIGNSGGVLVFASGANGNVAPAQILTDSNLSCCNVSALALDEGTAVAVVVGSSIFVYHWPVNGSMTQIGQLNGTATGITYPNGITYDSAGDLFVSSGSLGNGTLLKFAPGAAGNVAPIWSLSGANTALNTPLGIALH